MAAVGRADMPVPEGVQSHDNPLRKRFLMRLSESDEKGIARAYSRLIYADRLAFLGCSIYNSPRFDIMKRESPISLMQSSENPPSDPLLCRSFLHCMPRGRR